VNGQTIHSFFGFKPDVTLQKIRKVEKRMGKKNTIYTKLDAIVIDEISMVRADLLDCVDKFLRLNGPKSTRPFGGIQMIFIGDLYQLPPVLTSADRLAFSEQYASPYFFAARVFSPEQTLLSDANVFSMELVELEKIYRQHDDVFISLLNAVRNNTITAEELELLASRYDPAYEPPRDAFEIHLTTTNAMAAEVNAKHLAQLKGRQRTFTGSVSGKFERNQLPTDEMLDIKIGAQVMLLNNDRGGRWINGTIGKIVDITRDKDIEMDVVMIELPNGDVEPVLPYTWDMYAYRFDANNGQIESDTIGSFTQYPFRLAWAVTIHKAQGKTFDRVILDIGRGTFAPGQLYVALSRCTTLEGLVLKRPVAKKHIFMDWGVVKFMTRFQYAKSEAALSLDEKVLLIENAIESEQALEIVYLKSSDVKSRRTIIPHVVGEMQYMDRPFIGVEAYCLSRKADRVFRVDKILEMQVTRAAP
ncbi:MAG: ATP-binding domain-containing protein, partial [Patescibacteria group bacterium]